MEFNLTRHLRDTSWEGRPGFQPCQLQFGIIQTTQNA